MQVTRKGQFIQAVRCDGGDDRRRHGRLPCEGTRSTLGKVIDLSLSGAKVSNRGGRLVDEGDQFCIELRWEKTALRLNTRVVRVQKVGFRRYTYGLEFIDLDDQTRSDLTHLSRVASDRFVIVR